MCLGMYLSNPSALNRMWHKVNFLGKVLQILIQGFFSPRHVVMPSLKSSLCSTKALVQSEMQTALSKVELRLPIPFPTTITIRLSVPPIYLYAFKRRHLQHNSYYHRKWTQQPKFKSYMNLFARHIVQTSLGKVWIWIVSLQLWENSRALVWQLVLQKENFEFIPVKLYFKNLPCITSCL